MLLCLLNKFCLAKTTILSKRWKHYILKGMRIMSEEVVINFNKVTKKYKLYKDDKKRLLGLIFKNIKCKEKNIYKYVLIIHYFIIHRYKNNHIRNCY